MCASHPAAPSSRVPSRTSARRSGRRAIAFSTASAAATVGLGLTFGPAFAGEIVPPPGGGTHDSTGAFTSSWQLGGNWNTGLVPGEDDSVIVLGGPFNNIFLDAPSANLGSLFVANAKTISNNGFLLDVTSGSATATVTGVDSSLFIVPVPGNATGFRADELLVSGTGRLQMAGGRVRVLDQLTLASQGRIVGHGEIIVNSSAAGAFNGIGGGTLSVSGGDLRIEVTDGGSLAVPNLIVLNGPSRTLEIVGEVFAPLVDVDLGQQGTLSVEDDWFLSGTLVAGADPGDWATITGGEVFVDGGVTVSAGGSLRFEPMATFGAAGTMSIANGAQVELLGDDSYSEIGHLTTISPGGRLRLPATQIGPRWGGDINLLAGATLETDTPSGYWRMDGELQMGGVNLQPSRVEGSAAVRSYGGARTTGTGGVVGGTLEMMLGSTLELSTPISHIRVEGQLRLRGGSETIGSGRVEVAPGGTLVLEPTADVDVDVRNRGTLRVGAESEPEYVYINGDLTQFATGVTRIAIGGPANPDRDIIETSGAATLDGTLNMELLDGFVPEVGDSFEIMWVNGGVNGSFATVAGVPGFEISYEPSFVIATFVGVDTCTGDLTGDGFVDIADLLGVLAAWGECEDCPVDLDGDGGVGIGDLLIILAQWGSCV